MSGSLEEQILDILREYLSPIVAKSTLSLSSSWASMDINEPQAGGHPKLISELKKGIQLYLSDVEKQDECVARVSALLAEQCRKKPIDIHPVSIEIREESDIVTARGRGATMCSRLGFPKVVQVKVTTAISELARNIVQYAGQGEVTITPMESGIEVVARDQGPGIDDLDTVLNGKYSSRTGMGMGLLGTKKLMDEFEIQTERGLGTKIRVKKFL